mmetsp:Transcript_51530/g.130234  ORF Transcript_51530/g.130234 Transcript_51530/m.130234 type:complete len:404 (-) Transcript_51530:76-1287(-)
MGNQACCAAADDAKVSVQAEELRKAEAVPVVDGADAGLISKADAPVVVEDHSFKVTLSKTDGMKLGLDVDYMIERSVLPVMSITGGLAENWNNSAPEDKKMKQGDSIVEVNGIRNDVAAILESCKNEKVLNITLVRGLSYDNLVNDLEKLIKEKPCGPLLIRLSWHDAGVFSTGSLTGGCPNAAMRHKGSGEAAFDANKGLDVAVGLLAPISGKYCPYLISHADLWTLAANVAIRVMGGPDIVTKFGRTDATSAAAGVESQVGRLPDGDKGADHLRAIFNPKGFDDKAIVALSGAHTVGSCHLDRSGFEGAWTEQPDKFDNSYFQELLKKSYAAEQSKKGCPQHRHAASGTIMLNSDLALLQDPKFKQYVETYASDKNAFFNDFSEAWVKLQENGCTNLREIL